MNTDAISMELLIELGKEALMKKQLREQRKLVKQLQRAAPAPTPAPAPEQDVVPEPAIANEKPKNNFQCDDFQQMVLSGVLPEGTIVSGKRNNIHYSAIVKIRTKAGGAREAFLVSEPNAECFNWQGCIVSSPSAFRKAAWLHETPENPPKKSKGNGWTWLHVGSETGLYLEILRRQWKGESEAVVVEDNE